jgi:hypothetical protein
MAIDPQSGRVVERIGGFQKPVGVIAAAGSVWLADQRGGCIYKITNSTIAPICEGLPQPDSLAIADAESCFVTCWDEASRTGSVEQIHLDGTRRTVASGPWRPRGIASDRAFRLFVAPRNETRVVVLPYPRVTKANP